MFYNLVIYKVSNLLEGYVYSSLIKMMLNLQLHKIRGNIQLYIQDGSDSKRSRAYEFSQPFWQEQDVTQGQFLDRIQLVWILFSFS